MHSTCYSINSERAGKNHLTKNGAEFFMSISVTASGCDDTSRAGRKKICAAIFEKYANNFCHHFLIYTLNQENEEITSRMVFVGRSCIAKLATGLPVSSWNSNNVS